MNYINIGNSISLCLKYTVGETKLYYQRKWALQAVGQNTDVLKWRELQINPLSACNSTVQQNVNSEGYKLCFWLIFSVFLMLTRKISAALQQTESAPAKQTLDCGHVEPLLRAQPPQAAPAQISVLTGGGYGLLRRREQIRSVWRRKFFAGLFLFVLRWGFPSPLWAHREFLLNKVEELRGTKDSQLLGKPAHLSSSVVIY